MYPWFLTYRWARADSRYSAIRNFNSYLTTNDHRHHSILHTAITCQLYSSARVKSKDKSTAYTCQRYSTILINIPHSSQRLETALSGVQYRFCRRGTTLQERCWSYLLPTNTRDARLRVSSHQVFRSIVSSIRFTFIELSPRIDSNLSSYIYVLSRIPIISRLGIVREQYPRIRLNSWK